MEEGTEIPERTPLDQTSRKILENDRRLEGMFNLTERLGITDERERFFFYRYFDLRARRAGGIGISRLLSHPMIQELRGLPIIGGIIHSVQDNQEKADEELAKIKELLAREIDQEYTTPEAHDRIKIIEMAANDLASKGIVQGEVQSSTSAVVADIEGIVQPWSESWKNKLIE